MGWILALVFVWVSLANAVLEVRARIQKKHESLVPLIGGLAGVGAFLTLPYPH